MGRNSPEITETTVQASPGSRRGPVSADARLLRWSHASTSRRRAHGSRPASVHERRVSRCVGSADTSIHTAIGPAGLPNPNARASTIHGVQARSHVACASTLRNETVNDMLKFLASTAGVIFLIGLVVVIGLLMLIF